MTKTNYNKRILWQNKLVTSYELMWRLANLQAGS